MTVLEVLDHIDRLIAAWQADEITALQEGRASVALECRLRIGTLEQLAENLRQKVAA